MMRHAALVVISVLLGSAVLVVPVSATPTAQASGGFQSGRRAVKPWLRLELTEVLHLLHSNTLFRGGKMGYVPTGGQGVSGPGSDDNGSPVLG